MIYYPLASTIVSGIFTVLLVIQYMRRRKIHQLIWAISLFMFFVTTFLEFWAEYLFLTVPGSIGWTELSYKIYYILTPTMVALMGTGSLYLLTHKPYGKYFLYYTTAVSIPLFILGLSSSLGDSLYSVVAQLGTTEIGGKAMPSYVRIFSPFLTVPGGIALIGGALYSFWLDKSRKYNLLIALGALFPFIGGVKVRFADPTFFYFLEMVGTILLFLGFVLSWEYIRSRKAGGK
jgi:hypothetical protein